MADAHHRLLLHDRDGRHAAMAQLGIAALVCDVGSDDGGDDGANRSANGVDVCGGESKATSGAKTLCADWLFSAGISAGVDHFQRIGDYRPESASRGGAALS